MQAEPAPIPALARRRPDVPVEVLAARTLSLGGLELRPSALDSRDDSSTNEQARDRARGMTTLQIDENDLPPYTPPREPCRLCGRRDSRIMVIFDRDCGAVGGDHYHRECLACGARWLEQCARSRGA
jgi:hypothetical protein